MALVLVVLVDVHGFRAMPLGRRAQLSLSWTNGVKGENGFYTIDKLCNGSFAMEQCSSAYIPNTNKFNCLYTTRYGCVHQLMQKPGLAPFLKKKNIPLDVSQTLSQCVKRPK
jgi:hypothetical protein